MMFPAEHAEYADVFPAEHAEYADVFPAEHAECADDVSRGIRGMHG
jgi:hypothetical protein